MTTITITIIDRNLIAFLIASGHACEFEYSAGNIAGIFKSSVALRKACQNYSANAEIPVQNFIAACRHISSVIREQKGGR